jgi:RHS repeat-associated protein
MGGAPFAYDVNGNLVTDTSKTKGGEPLRIRYRDDNLPFLFTYKDGEGNAVKAFMIYDEAGGRVSKIVKKSGEWVSTKSYFASGKEVREREDSSPIEFYSMAGVGRVSYPVGNSVGHRETYLKDHLGSTRGVYDLDSMKMTYTTHYYPYGKSLAENHSTVQDVTEKFTTKELDQGIGLTYFGVRYYDQDLGVWTSSDRKRQVASVYNYGTNPVNTVDPDGKWMARGTLGDGFAGQVSLGYNDGKWSGGFKVGAGYGWDISYDPSNKSPTQLPNAIPARMSWEITASSGPASASYFGGVVGNSRSSELQTGVSLGVNLGHLTPNDIFGVPTSASRNISVELDHGTNTVTGSTEGELNSGIGVGGGWGVFGLIGFDFWED